MQRIDYSDLEILDENYSGGTFARVMKVFYDNKYYAYKDFSKSWCPNYLIGKRNKLDAISNIECPELLTPKYWVQKDNFKDNYLSLFCLGRNLIEYKEDPLTQSKILYLKKAKEAILQMHKEGIIHTDINPSNIIIPFNTNDAKIIDFDNSTYKDFNTNVNDCSDYAKIFIENYGACKELDIYLFNILTYYLINQNSYYLTRMDIYKDKYNYFKYSDKDIKNILDTILLKSNHPSDEFLIDTLDETKFKI